MKSNDRDITEKHLDDKSKLIIDIDLKYNSINRLITDDDIDNIIETINEILNIMFVDNDNLCYIF